MEKNKTVSFKDNIYRMFLRYAIAPAFTIAFAGVLFTFGVWCYTTIDSVRTSNREIEEELELVLGSYEDALTTIAVQTELVTAPVDKNTQVKVFEDIYRISNSLGYQAKLYVFNKDYEPVITSTKVLPEELKGDSVANWGIFRQMNRNPGETARKVIQDTENQFSSLYIGRTMQQNGEIKGYVVFSIDSAEFRVLLTKVAAKSILTDSFGWIYLANNYDFCDNLNRMSREYEAERGYITCNGKNFYITETDIMAGQLRIYSVANVSSQMAAFKWVALLLAMLFGVILFCLMRGATKISVQSTKDIDIISDAFEQVKGGNLSSYISICSSREFQTIGESYNLMLDSLKEQIEKNREMIAHMAFAQIKQLESQINPHFLFNTLENIRIMCKLDTAKADKMIVNLSSLLRYSISNAEEDVTVRQDMENTQHYLSILKMRFNRRFQYSIHMDEDIMELVIPKLLIQPLIENSIKYGFGDRENLTVEISGYREAECLIVVCRDDGMGIEQEILRELEQTLTQPKNRSSHLGLYNIHKRIQLKYNGDYGMSIKSEAGNGTTIILKLPVQKRK